MLQENLLVINVGVSFLAMLILFIASIILLVRTGDISEKKYLTPAVLSMSIGIFILMGLNFYQFIVDDVYISLRYARNLANGYGLVFNTDGSEPVEGYTNFLWIIFEAILFKLNFSEGAILHIIRVTGLALGIGVVLIVYLLMQLLEFDKRISLIAILFLCILPEFSFWAVGGLETMMYLFWLMLAIYRYLYERKMGNTHLWSMFFLLLLSLTRPEGLFISGVIVLYHLIHPFFKDKAMVKKSFYTILPGLVLFAILYGAYFLWRFNMYGYLFPNTFYAKKLSNSLQFFDRTKEIIRFVGPMFPFFALACIGYFQFRKKISYEKNFLLLILVTLIAFCYLARCEWMPGHRYELPFVPVLIIFFTAGVGAIFYSAIKSTDVRLYSKVVPFGLLLFFGGFLLSRFNDLRLTGNEFAKQLNRAHVPLGKWLKLHAPENSSYASWDMGAVPYYSGLHTIIDINLEGLLNPQTTHEGYNIDKLLSLNPSFLVLPPNTAYVRPRDILDFYDNPKFSENYEYLFAVAFTRDYILHVYKHKGVILTEVAVKEANNMANESRRDILY